MRKLFFDNLSHKGIKLYSAIRSGCTTQGPYHCEDVHILDSGLENSHLFRSYLLYLCLGELDKEGVDDSHQRLAKIVVHCSDDLFQEKT
jgi:hypothetical protein